MVLQIAYTALFSKRLRPKVRHRITSRPSTSRSHITNNNDSDMLYNEPLSRPCNIDKLASCWFGICYSILWVVPKRQFLMG
jgi:hypothetical protein